MSLQTRLTDLITAIATDYKQLRVWMTGSSSGTLSGLATADKSNLVSALNEVRTSAIAAPASATETISGIAEIATQAETSAGSDDSRIVTPLKLQQKLTAWAQPLSANLTTLSGVSSSTLGRAILSSASASDARSSLGLSAVAASGNAADLTGTLNTAQLPPLAINEVFVVANQAARLALTAQRGDVAIQTDNNKSYILAADDPSTDSNWKEITSSGSVTSVAGKTGAVSLVKADVGLGNVDNTSDSSKPVSTAQQAALDLKVNNSALGVANGVATLDASTKIVFSLLPVATSGTSSSTQVVRADDSRLSNARTPTAHTHELTDLPNAWVKRSVRVATTANITLSGTQTVDGVSLVVGDRVLVKQQTTGSQNGIYTVASGAWTRATDADTAVKLGNSAIMVEQGTVGARTLWFCNLDSTGTIGSSGVPFTLNLDSRHSGVAGGIENYVAPGTTSQYYRGDKTWQTLNVSAVSGAQASSSIGDPETDLVALYTAAKA